jgi:hypothetical protein
LGGIAAGSVPGVDGPTAAAIKDSMARAKDDPALGTHFYKEGNLDSDPMTMVKTGFFAGRKDAAPVVYVVALALPTPPSSSRADAHRRLEAMANAMLFALLDSVKKRG